MQYPVNIERDGKGCMVSFPDILDALTCGQTPGDAREMAADDLINAFECYFEEQRKVPMPSKDGQDFIHAPLSVWLKVLMLNEIIQSNETQASIAQQAGVARQEMQRIKSLCHNTKVDTISKIMTTLGKQIQVTVV